MVNAIQQIVRLTDSALARVYLSLFHERSALISFLFHSLFRNEGEIAQNVVDPLQRTTIAQFRSLIEYYLSHGYRFIRPDQILSGLAVGGKYALLTFDDGYFNNSLALPILEEFGVPALFFISTDHVLKNKCYWWDVVYRELISRGATRKQAYHSALAMKGLRTEQIEEQLIARYGAGAFSPRGDIDRPFSPTELRQFAASPYVHLGNHTANHAILTNYGPTEICEQLQRSQDTLRELTGVTPAAIAYPNGAYDARVLNACREVGLRLGFTIRPAKCGLPLHGRDHDLLELGRFIPHGGVPILKQCHTARSDVSLYRPFRDLYLKLLRRKPASSAGAPVASPANG